MPPLLVLAVQVAVLLASNAMAAYRPNIVIILADDMGWNDVSFHGSDEIPTPNIDALAYNGVILNQHYVLPVCTPSRSALMTGMYPIHLGMQGMPILGTEPRGLPLGTILPEYLQHLGYQTHAVGKWHLGFYRSEYLPTRRGFDSFLGYYNGANSYYDYILDDGVGGETGVYGFDLRRNESVAWDLQGRYATDVFTDQAVSLIRTHDQRVPMFLYLAHLAVHAGNNGKLLEAPQEVIDRFRHIADPGRRTYAAMVAKLDESVGRVVSALSSRGMLDNTIILFMSDNGAPTANRVYANWGSNAPLRGVKETLWEGGVRGVATLWSPELARRPRVSGELMHISDWLPTLYSAAGGSPLDLPADLDGHDQWPSLVADLPSPRAEILLNIDERLRTAAIRQNNWKLVIGTGQEGKYDGHTGSQGSDSDPTYNFSAVVNSPTGRALAQHGARTGWPTTREYTMAALRARATVRCAPNLPINTCNPAIKGCLFSVLDDPCETNNLADTYPTVARALKRVLVRYRAGLVLQPNTPTEPALANPRRFGGVWSPWRDGIGDPLPLLGASDALQAPEVNITPAPPTPSSESQVKQASSGSKGSQQPLPPAPADAPLADDPPATESENSNQSEDGHTR